MKKLYALLFVCLGSSFAFSQVAFTVVSPASISGGYEFTSNGDAPNWGLPNLLNPADAIQDTVVIYEDATPGINAQGVPFANEACAPAINNIAGKIALIYRYDGASTNDCYAGTKVLNAQNAGAIGVILVNRVDGVYGYDGTLDGPLTNIPFAFIGKSDGAIIRARIEAGDDVVAFLGNKLGLYGNDVGIVKNQTLAPSISATAALTAASSSEFGFDIGTKIFNYGSSTQSGLNLTATVTGPGGTWTETAGPFTLAMGDSVDVFTGGTNNIPAFTLSSYPVGEYTLSYSLDIGVPDESDFDNSLTYNFLINDNKVSFSKSDPVTGLPIPFTYTRSTATGFSACMVYNNPNGSRLGAEGIYFAAEAGYNTGAILEGEEFGISLYRWDDNFVDLDDPNFAFANLTIVANGSYLFGPNQNSTMVFAPFNIPVQLSDNQRYLGCVDVYNDNFWIGYSSRIDYTRNVDHYRQPLTPVSSSGTYYALGFGEDLVPSIALGVFDAAQLAIEENSSENLNLYPNPVNDQLTISKLTNPGVIKITDLSGRVVLETLSGNSDNNLDLSNLENGQYLVTVEHTNGSVSKSKFVKQ